MEPGYDESSGLTQAEARARLVRDGPNELPAQGPRGLHAIVLEVLREPMFLLLVAAGSLYLLLGKTSDAILLLCFVGVVITITVVQERRTERALDALRELASPRALVIRDGKRMKVDARELVVGDLVVVAEGDRVPADALLRRATHLEVDESVLTGESVPVGKRASAAASGMDRPGGEATPCLYSGTLVSAGQGQCEVVATGGRTEFGRIGSALQGIERESTPLQAETGRIVKRLALVGLVLCAVVVVAYGLTRGPGLQAWKEALLAGIAMAMAILPEEFPVVLTVFLALGAWRISRSHVLTRRMPAIETLGAATVLCVDKTGTLTQNRMRVALLHVQGRDVPVPDATVPEATAALPAGAIALVQLAALASRANPFDPMERAIVALRDALVPGGTHGAPTREYPLSSALTAVSQAWGGAEPHSYRIASKGSPEAIASLCHLDAPARAQLDADVARLAGAGLRVLAVAEGEHQGELPADHHGLVLRLAGLLCLADPLREDVPAAVAECQAAGIRIVMITGDYPATALAIARQAGLQGATRALTGPELATMDDAALARAIADVQVFARVVPEQKLRIVNALKANGEVVGMTGDGVNDAPALKAAHIGIAMGGRGTDVAREAASLVLLDDAFASIVAAVKLGRRIYDNIRKASMFILAVHVPIAGLSMIPVFIPGWPLLLLPVHIVFLELVIDPACSLVFEAEEAEADAMARPPRDRSQGLFQARAVTVALLQGLLALLACLGTFVLARRGQGDDAGRALAFCTLVAATLVIIIVNRSWSRSLVTMARVPNVALWWVLAGACTFLGLALEFAPLRRLFDFAPVHAGDLALSLAAGAGSVLVPELFKGPMARARAGTKARAPARLPEGPALL